MTLVRRTINHRVAKRLVETLYAEGGDQRLVAARLAQVSDAGVLGEAVARVLDRTR